MFSSRERFSPSDLSGRAEVLRGTHCTVRYAKNTVDQNRYAIIVGARVDPRSTRRHLLRRRVAHLLKKWPNMKCDILITLQKESATATAKELSASLDALRAKLVNKNTTS